jgi:hypothetical protein
MDASTGAIIGISVTLILFATLYGVAFYQMSTMVGSKDDWADVKKQVGLITGLVVAGTIFLACGVLLISAQFVDPIRVAYIAIVLSVFASCMSFGALATAAITR